MGIKQIINADLDAINKKYKNPNAIPYKIRFIYKAYMVALPYLKLETLLEKLPAILDDLREDHYFSLDFDVTQYFTGIFIKKEIIAYLISKYDFKLQVKDSTERSGNVIIDNTVGIDCLTWFNNNFRVKMYSKFICQITSPGVCKQLGNHIVNFVNCPDKRLKETFEGELAQENCITRLEATIYNYTNEYYTVEITYDPIKHCMDILEKNKMYFLKFLFILYQFLECGKN